VLFEEMKRRGNKTLAFIGFADAQGDASLAAVEKHVGPNGMKLVTQERYGRTDPSVTAQALRIIQANPDAVVFGASGAAAALPMRTLRERGYKGPFYQNHGVATNDFLRVGGAAGEGMLTTTGLVLVAEQLPDTHPSKKIAVDYVKAYEAKFGPGSRSPFGAYAFDAYLMLDNAVKAVGQKAAPGTPEFRAALRDALEQTKNLPLTHGIATTSADTHVSYGRETMVLITIENGAWKLVR
jgi:branched-chain amino acid transport system substrate-binding protein